MYWLLQCSNILRTSQLHGWLWLAQYAVTLFVQLRNRAKIGCTEMRRRHRLKDEQSAGFKAFHLRIMTGIQKPGAARSQSGHADREFGLAMEMTRSWDPFVHH